MVRHYALYLLATLLCRQPVLAGVDFNESQVRSMLDEVPSGSVVTVEVVLKNSGDVDSEVTDLRIRFPHSGFLVRIDDIPELKRDDLEREVTARLKIPAGDEYRFTFDLLAPRGSAGRRMSSDIEVRNFWAETTQQTKHCRSSTP
ncbi:MAG: hypothetical protein FJ267_04355 [Planctomycetes bacterium]|nr:hypothetical protein [Planctomycetota bacterium]